MKKINRLENQDFLTLSYFHFAFNGLGILIMNNTEFYDRLGVSKDASQDEIKKAYRKMSKKYHPDINKEAGAEQKYKDVQEAYETLSDSQKRPMTNTVQQAHKVVSAAVLVALVASMAVASAVSKTSSQVSLVAVVLVEIQMHLDKVMIFNTVLTSSLKKLFLVLKKRLPIVVKRLAILVVVMVLNLVATLSLVVAVMDKVSSMLIPKHRLV